MRHLLHQSRKTRSIFLNRMFTMEVLSTRPCSLLLYDFQAQASLCTAPKLGIGVKNIVQDMTRSSHIAMRSGESAEADPCESE